MNQRKAGAALSYVYLGLTFAIGVFYTPILLGFLGKSEYGVYSVAISAIAFLAILDLGFNQTMIRYIARYKALKDETGENKLNGMFLLLYMVIAALAFIVGLLIYFNLDWLFAKGFTPVETQHLKVIFLVLLGNLVISFPLGIFSSIISANEGFFYLKMVNIVSSVLTHGAILIALFIGYKSIAMAVITTAVSIGLKATTVFYGMYKYHIKFIFRGFDRKVMKEISIFSFYVFLNIVIDQLYANTDKMLLGILCGSAIVTTYAIGAQFYTYFEQFSTSISGVFLPQITRMVTTNDSMAEVSALFVKIGRIQFILLGFLMSGFILLGKQFVGLWVGKEQLTAYYIALVVILPALIPLSQNLGISILRALNRHKFRSIAYIFIALGNVALSIPAALKFGGVGAAAATGLATCIGQIAIMNWFYYKRVGLDIPAYWREIGKIVFVIFLCTLTGQLINLLIPGGSWGNLLIKGLIYCVWFLLIGWRFIFNHYEKNLLKDIFRKVTGIV